MSQDPYYDRLQEAVLELLQEQPANDPALVARLIGQAAPATTYAPPAVQVTEEVAPGPHGDVPVRVYRPNDAPVGAPVFVWCHGGAWVWGSLDDPEADATSREVCERAGAVVISVDYRLAAEGVHYPVPLDDVIAAMEWAREAAPRFGGDPGRLVLGGASAGANLAAGACQRLRDEGRTQVASLVLAYPCLHAPLPAPSEELAGKLGAINRVMAFAPEVLTPMVENYTGSPLEQTPVYAMPGHGDLSRLPPTLVINAEYDGLRASGEAATAALLAAGVECKQLLAEDVAHGHFSAPHLQQAQASFQDVADWLLLTTR